MTARCIHIRPLNKPFGFSALSGRFFNFSFFLIAFFACMRCVFILTTFYLRFAVSTAFYIR
jgi:hypothetical protein